ncbi:MAG TPA: DUF1800 domain-containing protein [Acidimicrobiales bacterium]|nr:DUF1800 domain-containing protein [Acidimicrobiales bacterium]
MDPARSDIAHLFRRTGFGALPRQLDALTPAGYESAVDHLLDVTAGDPGTDRIPDPAVSSSVSWSSDTNTRALQTKQVAQEETTLRQWWMTRMAAAERPLAEKMTLYWHGHFATGIDKVQYAGLMLTQNKLFRRQGLASFPDLTINVAKDPAMLIWLDTRLDRKAHPNENFARELMELFTLGIGHYQETDVREAARAFTGWNYDSAAIAYQFLPAQHDNGTKTVLGVTGNLSGEDVIRLVTSEPIGIRFVAARLWSHFAYPVTIDDPVVDDLVAAYAPALRISDLMRAILLHPAFRSAKARTGLVKQPIEYVAGVMRALNLTADMSFVDPALANLGQVPLRPPNVGGWPQNGYWLSTSASRSRLAFARAAAAKTDLRPVTSTRPAVRYQALSRVLSVDFSPGTTAALQAVATNPVEMMALALVSPEYVAN